MDEEEKIPLIPKEDRLLVTIQIVAALVCSVATGLFIYLIQR